MILLHRLKGEEFYLNHHLIETVERVPDTMIVLTNERRYTVKESPDEIIDLIAGYEQKILTYNKESGSITRESP